MTPNRLITIAIHTYEKALPIKQLLEREGIYVELNNVNLASPTVSVGVRIRIKESDLPLALRIIENIEIFDMPQASDCHKGGVILLPTDFSQHSNNAARLAFHLASRLGYSIELLHTFIAPEGPVALQFADSYDYSLSDMEKSQQLAMDARKRMDSYVADLREWMKTGEVPAVKFTTTVKQGIPEEVILNYSREQSPQMIVMGTRGADKKEAELIGSVTAEVLDSCRIPAFTVPEGFDVKSLMRMRRVTFICNLDQEDMIALDTLYRLFYDQSIEVMLIHLPGRRDGATDSKTGKAQLNLLNYCRDHFPKFGFDMHTVGLDTLIEDFRSIIKEKPFSMICVPNKKRNVFARVFNPSIAHKILFRADVPMMVIPV